MNGFSLFLQAVDEVVLHSRTILIASLLPVMLLSLVHLARDAYLQNYTVDVGSMANYMVASVGLFWLTIPFYVLFATNCHRVVLLGDGSLANKLGLYWSYNETRFLGWVFVIGLITTIVTIPTVAIPIILREFDITGLLTSVSTYVGLLLAVYIDGRVGLVLPATAIGRRLRLRQSWQATGPVGWSIFLALVIPAAITEAIDYVLFVELFPSSSLAVSFVRGLLYYPLIAIGVAVLTIAYRDLFLTNQEEVNS